MKILGFYVTREDYESLYNKKCNEAETLDHCVMRVKRESNEVHELYSTLQHQYSELSSNLKEKEDILSVRNEDIKELRSSLEDNKSANAELSERLEKEQSDNCELQNLYSAKCKECDEAKEHAMRLADSYNRIAEEKAALEAAKAAAEDKFEKYYGIYGREGYVVVKEDHYNKLKDVYEKKQIENETRNANRRKNRAAKAAAKKVAHAKPE